MQLKAGQRIRLDKSDAEGSDECIPLPHKEIFDVLKPSAILLIDNERLRLNVESIAANGIDGDLRTIDCDFMNCRVNRETRVCYSGPATSLCKRQHEFLASGTGEKAYCTGYCSSSVC